MWMPDGMALLQFGPIVLPTPMNEHVNSLYAIRLFQLCYTPATQNTLRAHGMNNEGIQNVFRAKIVSETALTPHPRLEWVCEPKPT